MRFVVGDSQINVNLPSERALLDELEARFASGRGFALATLNLDHLVKLRTDNAFQEAYAAQDLVTADGNPVVWLSRIAGAPVDLLPGSDLVRPVLRLAARHRVPVAFLGSTEPSLARAADALSAEIPGLDIRACVAPPMGFDPTGPEAQRILDDLASRDVRLLLLALGAPKQELLAALGRSRVPAMGFLSIGAGLDFISGTQRRAPAWVRRLALEWLWRALGQPRRLAARYARCALILPGHALRAWAQGRRPRPRSS